MKVKNDSFLTCLSIKVVRDSMFDNDHCSLNCFLIAQLAAPFMHLSFLGLFMKLKTVGTLFSRRLPLAEKKKRWRNQIRLLSPKSDQHQISPRNILLYLIKTMRINNMVTTKNYCLDLSKIPQLIL